MAMSVYLGVSFIITLKTDPYLHSCNDAAPQNNVGNAGKSQFSQ